MKGSGLELETPRASANAFVCSWTGEMSCCVFGAGDDDCVASPLSLESASADDSSIPRAVPFENTRPFSFFFAFPLSS